ncbi:YkvA family protein [Cerasibacillus sp. JNUCC 74]|jgi:uncharacterized membrane protein YkvA (DUF1232 family)|uniref:YkvA family protein n=1 Tax=Virgibacillus proomii TaxID=84407 RepID=UPI0009868CBC|nr:DUF1232 domain-containing protein [Virgibacillus proomii]
MRKIWSRIRFLFTFHKSIPFVKDFFLSKEVSKSKKLLFVAVITGYFLFPFDIIPDFLLGFGMVDDVTLLLFILQWMVKIAPEDIKDKYSF